MFPVHQVWPKPTCKAQWKGEEDKADRGRGGICSVPWRVLQKISPPSSRTSSSASLCGQYIKVIRVRVDKKSNTHVNQSVGYCYTWNIYTIFQNQQEKQTSISWNQTWLENLTTGQYFNPLFGAGHFASYMCWILITHAQCHHVRVGIMKCCGSVLC